MTKRRERRGFWLFVGLQYLRAYAALLVVFFHASVNSKSGIIIGESGVDVFFVLSGFLMWRVTNAETTSFAFMRNRIRRIVPVYWIATLAVFACAELGITSRVMPDLGHLLTSLFFLPFKGPGGVYPMLIVGWTLNYEMFFYVVFAGLLVLPRRYIPVALTVTFAGLACLRPFAGGSLFAQFYTNPIILEFVAGVWLAVALEKTPGRQMGIVLLLFGILGTLAGGDMPRIIGYGVPAVLCVWGMLAIERDGDVPSIAPLRLAGDASYSIYLWHLFGISLLAPLLIDRPLATLGLFAAGLAMGLAGWFLLERPILNRLSRPAKA